MAINGVPSLEPHLVQLEAAPGQARAPPALAAPELEVIDLTSDFEDVGAKVQRVAAEKAAAVEAKEAAEQRAAELAARVAQLEADLEAERASAAAENKKRKREAELSAEKAECSAKAAKVAKEAEIAAAVARAKEEGADQARAEAAASIAAAGEAEKRAKEAWEEARAQLNAAVAEKEALAAEVAVQTEKAAKSEMQCNHAIAHQHEMDPILAEAKNYKDAMERQAKGAESAKAADREIILNLKAKQSKLEHRLAAAGIKVLDPRARM